MTDLVTTIRRFNRTVTQRVGAQMTRFLALDRPLAAARLLWEIGPNGCEVRALETVSTSTPATPAACGPWSRTVWSPSRPPRPTAGSAPRT